MNNLPIVSSLRIKKLFGQHDLSIDFKKLTVIVGKNGMGKTTVLKIINSLITGDTPVDYKKIAESVELNFSDGNAICYGIVSNSFVDAIDMNDFTKIILEDKDVINTVGKILEGMTSISEQQKKMFVKEFFSAFASQEDIKDKIQTHFSSELRKDPDKIISNKVHLDKFFRSTNIRYISTVNISANAGKKMDFGNSIERNLLDIAIYEELRILMRKASKSVSEKFISQLNSFLEESGKTIRRDHGEWVIITDSSQRLTLEQLSSGERQLAYILATAANTCGKPTLFLMDEPEVSLHLSWQEKILDAIMNVNPQMQIIAVTHSPGIIMNGHMDAYVEMKDIMQVCGNV
ncbi:AAA family ATPase [Pantoea ananatis]|uniref:AAA family ATPase n=1 Tax=Pantoea ananas TaxID=553 RepID=UPI0025C94160|nr:AAA family ATPase [Pantoea ananatis]MDN4128125.1 AAA family ATPase [Pantoea ananatis]MDN4152239.1 AAA family ATPase [Pantoea ananatis]